MRRSLVIVLVVTVLLLMASQVQSINLLCPSEVNLEEQRGLVCELYTDTNASLRLAEVDGVEVRPGHLHIVVRDAAGEILSPYDFGRPPLRAEVNIGGLLGHVASEKLWGYSYYWVLYNKVHWITFEVLLQDGTSERVTLSVYVSGNPWEVIRAQLYFILVVVALLVLLGLIDTLRERKGLANSCGRITSWTYVLALGFLFEWYELLGPLIVYFLGRTSTLEGDTQLSWAAYVLLVFSAMVLVHVSSRCRKNRTKVITGLEWVPLSILFVNESLLVGGIVAFVGLLVLQNGPFVEALRRISPIVSPVYAVFLGKTLGAGPEMVVFVTGLALLYPLLALLYVHGEPSLEEDGIIVVKPRSPSDPPSARELLAKLDSVVKQMKWEGATPEEVEQVSVGGERLSEWIPLGHPLGFTLADYESVKNQRAGRERQKPL